MVLIINDIETFSPELYIFFSYLSERKIIAVCRETPWNILYNNLKFAMVPIHSTFYSSYIIHN